MALVVSEIVFSENEPEIATPHSPASAGAWPLLIPPLGRLLSRLAVSSSSGAATFGSGLVTTEPATVIA